MTLSLLSDREIKELCEGDRLIGSPFADDFRPMLSPFVPELVREIVSESPISYDSSVTYLKRKVISYGLSSYGYDLRLAAHDFRIFKDRNIFQKLGLQKTPIVDPKNFDENLLYKAQLHCDHTGKYFIMPPHSSALGVSVECFDMPRNVTGICLGKSTYARSAITPFVTPIEAGWRGYPTLEFGNNTDLPCKIYANEGVLQMVFNRGADCDVSYGDRNGKYQDQACEVVLARA
jgi:dCTP deaminase